MKGAREKEHITNRGTMIQMVVDFPSETLKTRRQESSMFKELIKKIFLNVPIYNTSENIFGEINWNKDILRGRNIKKTHCQHLILKEMLKKFLKWERNERRGNLELQKVRKSNINGKYLGRYETIFPFWNYLKYV